ncbi:MAG: hypothetical protein HGA31_04315 [Candidatus Moranbacteria bacterium]|nr:hypothetical protein [Candidatus Moranbacteria bacterium]
MANIELPFWRACILPFIASLAAVAFWISYYRSIGWWPVVLFVIFAMQYAYYLARLKKVRKNEIGE